MSDFSAFSLFTAGLACLIPFSAAYTQPTGDAPQGNPISQPGLQSVVPVGKGFAITWQPTTQGTVTLVLLKGPPSNAVPQYPIVEMIPNDGEYVWVPSTNLEPTEEAEGYGIQLIDDATGQYQYTTQFGISNPDYAEETSSSKPIATPPTYGSHTSTPPVYLSTTKAVIPPYYTPSVKPNNTTAAPPKYTSITKPHNVTMIAPTAPFKPSTISISASPTAPASSATTTPVEYTGGAAGMATSLFALVLAAGVAVFAL